MKILHILYQKKMEIEIPGYLRETLFTKMSAIFFCICLTIFVMVCLIGWVYDTIDTFIFCRSSNVVEVEDEDGHMITKAPFL